MFVPGCNPVDDDDGDIDNRKDGEQVNSEIGDKSRFSSDDTASNSKSIAERNHLNSSSLTRPSNVLYLNDCNFLRPNYIREWGDPRRTGVNRRAHGRDSKNSSTELTKSIENYQEFKDVENLQSFVIGNAKKASEKPVEKTVEAR